MAERREYIRTVRVHKKCNSCESGDMIVNLKAPVALSEPPQYLHECNSSNCYHQEYYTNVYPYVMYETATE